MTGRRRTQPVPVLLAAAFVTVAASRGTALETRLTPQESRDLLEPWSMEVDLRSSAPAPLSLAVPVAVPSSPLLGTDSTGAAGAAVADGATATPSQPPLVPDDSNTVPAGGQDAAENVVVVRCRQLLVGQPNAAERLGELLRGGASLEAARRAVGNVDLTERVRDYAIDELEPDLRREVEDLPEGGWSRTRPWNGRVALFQVVSKASRARASIPALGAGLSADEQSQLARTVRDRPAPAAYAAANQAADETRDVDPAAVVQQVQPTPPENATDGGTVVVVVQVGRTDDVIDVRVESSSNPMLDQAAIAAARRCTYRSARRDGIPEPGAVKITFNFPAPHTD